MPELYSSTFFVSSNTHAISIPKGEENKNGSQKILEEIMAENSPSLGKDLQIQAG